MNKNIYCTLDTETYGGASNPKGIYHLGAIIHDKQGVIYGCVNYLIAEHYNEISLDDYAKKNMERYAKMVAEGTATMIDTEEHAVEAVHYLCDFFNVHYLMAFNTGFDFCKTSCRSLLEDFEFIDIYLMACQTVGQQAHFLAFCDKNNLLSSSKKCFSTTAETFYAFITGNCDYQEEHTALEDAKIEMEIFLRCLRTGKRYSRNCHLWDYPDRFNLFHSVAKYRN